MKEHCPLKAQFILPWGGKLMKMCMIHANGLCVIANAIGSPISAEPITQEVDCMGPNDLDQYEKAKETEQARRRSNERRHRGNI